jgi:hypothetical protein
MIDSETTNDELLEAIARRLEAAQATIDNDDRRRANLRKREQLLISAFELVKSKQEIIGCEASAKLLMDAISKYFCGGLTGEIMARS